MTLLCHRRMRATSTGAGPGATSVSATTPSPPPLQAPLVTPLVAPVVVVRASGGHRGSRLWILTFTTVRRSGISLFEIRWTRSSISFVDCALQIIYFILLLFFCDQETVRKRLCETSGERPVYLIMKISVIVCIALCVFRRCMKSHCYCQHSPLRRVSP